MSHQGTWANALVKQEWSKLLIHNLKHVHTNFTYRILLIFKTHSNVMYLIYSQFPLISHLINSCEHIKWCLSSTPLESSKYLHKRQILIGLWNFRDKTMPSGVGRGGKSISYTSPPHGTGGVTGSSGVNGSKTTSSLYSYLTTKLNQMEYLVTCIFPTLYQLNLNYYEVNVACLARFLTL